MIMQVTPIYDSLMETPEYEDLEILPEPERDSAPAESMPTAHDTTPLIPDLDGIIQDSKDEDEPEPIEDPEGEVTPINEHGEEALSNDDNLNLEHEEDETLPLDEEGDEKSAPSTEEATPVESSPTQEDLITNLDPSTDETDSPAPVKSKGWFRRGTH